MLGKGKIEMRLQRTSFAPGDTISGNVSLSVKKPVKARGVSVSLIGEQKSTRVRGMTGGNNMSRSTQTVRIYDFKLQLDGEAEYAGDRNYNFEIKIPADILNAKSAMPEMGGVLGQGLKIAKTAAAMTGALPFQQTKWYLMAKLDIPGGLDVKKKADVTIG